MTITTPLATIVRLLNRDCVTYRVRGEYRPKDITGACEREGIVPSWKIIAESDKVSRGVYIHRKWRATAPVQDVPDTTPEPLKVTATAEVVALAPTLPSKREGVISDSAFAYVPEKNPEYIPFGDHRDVERIVESKIFYPILITGQSGNGKTMTVEQACAKAGRPFIRINCTKKTDEEALIGTKTLINGDVVVKEGPMLIAMRSGAIILLDEVSCSDASSIMCIQGIMEGKPFYFALTGEYIKPAQGFNIIMTDNTKGQGSEDGRYVGTNVLNEAFLERIGSTYEQEYPTPAVELRIVLKRMEIKGCLDQNFAEGLVKWAEAIRKTFKDGGVDSVISTRRLGHIVDNFAIFGNKKKAISQCTARFQDTTKESFLKLWDSFNAA
jgi:MoxR-like ATPase